MARFMKREFGAPSVPAGPPNGGNLCDWVYHRAPGRVMTGFFALLLALVFGVPAASAQQTAVCSNTPGTDQRVECKEDADSTSNIDIDLEGVDIDTTGANAYGVHAEHLGDGFIDVSVRPEITGDEREPSTIDTTSNFTHGIYGRQVGDNRMWIDSLLTQITIQGVQAHGIHGLHEGTGLLKIQSTADAITTTGNQAHGIYGRHFGTGDIEINAIMADIKTQGQTSYGIYGQHHGDGDIRIDFSGTVSMSDVGSPIGLFALHCGFDATAIRNCITPDQDTLLNTLSSGDIHINAEHFTIQRLGTRTTRNAHSIFARHLGDGDLYIDARHGTITKGATSGHGIRTYNRGTGSIDIYAEDVDITTNGENSVGISALAESLFGSQHVEITTRDVDISTMGEGAHGIWGWANGDMGSDVVIDVQGGHLSTFSSDAHPIHAQAGSGAIDIDVQRALIDTHGLVSHGIDAQVLGGEEDLDIDIRDVIITSNSTALDPVYNDTFSLGIYATGSGSGNIYIDAHAGTTVTTKGAYSYGIRSDQTATGTGDINITTHPGSSITTTGTSGHGLVTYHRGTMDSGSINIMVGGAVDTSGENAQGVKVGTLTSGGAPDRVAGFDADGYRRQTVTVNGTVTGGTGVGAAGVYLAGGGRVVIGSRGVIRAANGLAIHATGDTPPAVENDPPIKPKLHVHIRPGGRRMATVFPDGGYIVNDGGETTLVVNGTTLHDGATGNTGRTARNGAWNVRLRAEGVNVPVSARAANREDWMIPEPAEGVVMDRDFSTGDFNERRRPRPTPSPPQPRTVRVDRPIFGDVYDAAGVFLPAGGRVVIGPEGTLGAQSGIAIHAAGDAPMLRVDLNLNGRRMARVLGDNWIINDGGETTIVVNEVTLHDGMAGVVPDAVAQNGAWNVTMREEGVKVTARSTVRANWVITEPATGVIADRDFSTADFTETRKPPPPPPMCPEGQVGTPPNCTTPEPEQPMFMEEYAPRAALYEALPGFLLRLTGRGPAGAGSRPGNLAFPESPVWVRFSGGGGTSAPARSTVGVDYDFNRFQAELGVTLSSPAPWAEGLTGSLAVRHTQGTTTVTAPTGGGSLDAQGLGVAFGLAYQGAAGAYFNGWGLVTHYNVDIASETEGRLKRDAGVLAHAFGLETGHRVRLTETTHLTPRMWLVRSDLSMDRFTDTVDAQVALQDAEHLAGGIGLLAATRYVWSEDHTLALRGSVDVEQAFNDRETVVAVSGESLTSNSQNTRVLLGLGGAYRWGQFSVSSEVSVGGLDSSDQEFFGQLNLGLSF